MKKVLLLFTLIIVSASVQAQLLGKKSEVIAAEKAEAKRNTTSSYYFGKAGTDLTISGSMMLGSIGLSIGAAYVDGQSARDLMYVGAGAFGLASVIFMIDGGVNLSKAGKLLKKEQLQHEQPVARIEPARSGLGLRIVF